MADTNARVFNTASHAHPPWWRLSPLISWEPIVCRRHWWSGVALWGQSFQESRINIGKSAASTRETKRTPHNEAPWPLHLPDTLSMVVVTLSFLLQSEACGRSSNRLKPKYERGMLTGGSEKDWGFGRRALGYGVMQIGEAVLTVIRIFWQFGKYVCCPRISDYYTSTQMKT